jgi:hypothetical protein
MSDLTNDEVVVRAIMRHVPDLVNRVVKTPTKRLGFVVDAPSAFDPVSVIVDGDVNALEVINATGLRLAAGDRVVVDFYPPHGVLVTGRIDIPPSSTEDPHFVGAANQPAFENGWAVYSPGSGYAEPSFWKDPAGVVHLEGMIAGGSATATMFTLPVGYRPAGTRRFLTLANGNVTSVQAFADGTVRQTATGTTSNAWVSLSGISFVAEDPLGTPPFIPDRQYPGSTYSADETLAPDWPGAFRRADGWWLYKGYVGATTAAASTLRLMPEDSVSEWSHIFRTLAFTAAATGHTSRRVDVNAQSGGTIDAPEAIGVRVSFDMVRWWDHTARDGWETLGPLQNGWGTYTANARWAKPAWRLDSFGQVHLTGLLAPGTTTNNTVIATLPQGARPAGRHVFTIGTTNGAARLGVHADGTIRVESGADGWGATYASLSGVRFRASV